MEPPLPTGLDGLNFRIFGLEKRYRTIMAGLLAVTVVSLIALGAALGC